MTTTTMGNAQDIYLTMKCVRALITSFHPLACLCVCNMCVYYVCVLVCVCTCVFPCVCVCERERECVCISLCLHVCERECVSVCVCACVSEREWCSRTCVPLYFTSFSLTFYASLTSPSFFPLPLFFEIVESAFFCLFSYKSEATRRTSTWQPKISLCPLLSILLPITLSLFRSLSYYLPLFSWSLCLCLFSRSPLSLSLCFPLPLFFPLNLTLSL